MIRHYIKLALRGIWTKPLVFLASFVAIALGTISISFLWVFINNELTADNFHEREKDIYVLMCQDSPQSEWKGFSLKMVRKFKQSDYPEIEVHSSVMKYNSGELEIKHEGTTFSPEVLVVDSSFFKVFSFRLLSGDEQAVARDPLAMLVTESFARKHFGDSDILGRSFVVSDDKRMNYSVRGIIKDPPSNSSIDFDVVLFHNPSGMGFSRVDITFFMTGKGFDRDEFRLKIEHLARDHVQFKESKLDVLPLNEVYFSKGSRSRFVFVFSRFGDMNTVHALLIILAVIFAVTLLNFTNLQQLGVADSRRSLGISRIIGAHTPNIMLLKILETSILVVISLLFVTVLFFLLLPQYDRLIQVQLTPSVTTVLCNHLVIVGVIALIALGFSLNRTIRSSVMHHLKESPHLRERFILAKPGLIIQFAITILLLTASMVVFKQWNMMLHKDLGWSAGNIIRTSMFSQIPVHGTTTQSFLEQREKYQKVKNELEACPYIECFSQGGSPLEPFSMSWKPESGDSEYTTLNLLVVNPGYDRLFGWTLTDGRFFDAEMDSDRQQKVVINEAAQKLWGLSNIEDTGLLNSLWSAFGQGAFSIVGVVKDFYYERLTVDPKPLMMVYFEDEENDFFIRFADGVTEQGLEYLRTLHDEVNADSPFQYTFMSDEVASMYQKEKRFGMICGLFTLVALLITCSGLFAKSLRNARQRTKEIGIRKVNGARISEVMLLLNKDFLICVFIAFVIATPIAWYATTKWLESFAYKTPLSWWVFALAGLLALGIALLTVSWQSWKAATRNPVESLRYE